MFGGSGLELDDPNPLVRCPRFRAIDQFPQFAEGTDARRQRLPGTVVVYVAIFDRYALGTRICFADVLQPLDAYYTLMKCRYSSRV